jgi:hypothetical protein
VDEQILKGSDDGVQHSGILGFWTLSIVRYSKEHNVSEAVSVSVLRLGVGDTYFVDYIRRSFEKVTEIIYF